MKAVGEPAYQIRAVTIPGRGREGERTTILFRVHNGAATPLGEHAGVFRLVNGKAIPGRQKTGCPDYDALLLETLGASATLARVVERQGFGCEGGERHWFYKPFSESDSELIALATGSSSRQKALKGL
jgi:hypothetical protein